MNLKKTIFVAFAIEDEKIRDLIKGQSLYSNTPFEYVDAWKTKVRTRIRRSDGVLVIVSANSLQSAGQKWEIQCAKLERKPIRGIWAYKNDRTTLIGVNTMVWTWRNISNWIDFL